MKFVNIILIVKSISSVSASIDTRLVLVGYIKSDLEYVKVIRIFD